MKRFVVALLVALFVASAAVSVKAACGGAGCKGPCCAKADPNSK